MKKITLILFIFTSIFAFGQSVATYSIKFTNHWNSSDHSIGTTFPGANAHWSKLVGANHNSSVTFFEVGGMATAGVENIAELGNKDTFETVDVQNAIDANNAEQFIDGPDLFLNAGSSITINLDVDEDYPLLTLLSMIAPSPDWMIGINSLDLRPGGNWVSSIDMDLFPYDAGTEEGSAYDLDNAETNPQGTISNISGTAPFNAQRVARIEITLVSVLGVNSINTLDNLVIFPNPSKGDLTISNINNQVELKNIEVYNVLGKLVKQTSNTKNLSNINLDLSNFNKGIYLLKLNTNKGDSKTQKIVIN